MPSGKNMEDMGAHCILFFTNGLKNHQEEIQCTHEKKVVSRVFRFFWQCHFDLVYIASANSSALSRSCSRSKSMFRYLFAPHWVPHRPHVHHRACLRAVYVSRRELPARPAHLPERLIRHGFQSSLLIASGYSGGSGRKMHSGSTNSLRTNNSL